MKMQMFNINWTQHRWAIFFCATSSLGALCYGYDQIYYTGVLGMKRFVHDYGTTHDKDGNIALTTTFISLTASIIYVGELVGALISAPINDFFGRKGVFLCASVCIIAGAVTQVADQGSMGVICLGRILIGLGIGQFTVTCLLYIGEVAPQEIRGPALMMFQFMQSCSQLVGSGITQGTESITSTASYRIPMGLLALLPLLMLLGLGFIPESPVWYIRRGHPEKAARALGKINRSQPGYTPEADLAGMTHMVETERLREANSSWMSLIKDPIERRKLIFSCGAMVAQQINGIQFFYSYGVVFAQSIGIKQAFTISLITNTLQVVAVGVSVLLGNKVRRRANLLVTTVMMLLAYIIIGGLGAGPYTRTSFSTAIVVISYIIIVAFNFGHGPLAFTIASEMATGRNRNKIMSASIVSFFFTVWVIAFTSPYIYYDGGLGPMLGFVYAGTTCITLAYVYLCVGETTGRSHLEIELFFQKKIPVKQWRTHTFDSLDIAHESAVNGVPGEQYTRDSMGGRTLTETTGIKSDEESRGDTTASSRIMQNDNAQEKADAEEAETV
jgi:sugar porter (SP) family MFS transporter